MAKSTRFQELPLGPRPADTPIHRWLYDELRRAILGGRLKTGARLPSTRELARQQSVARTTVVAVFEQLLMEGYIASQVGSGTVVAGRLPDRFTAAPRAGTRPVAAPARAMPSAGTAAPQLSLPPPESGVRAFRLHEPGIDCFPVQKWAQLAARRLRLSPARLLGRGDARGYAPLREAVTSYLNTARGVHCDAAQVVIVSGTQQALDYVARLTLRPGDPVWLEEPGYLGARVVFRHSGARLVPVPVDQAGLDVAAALQREPDPKLVYITPAHQFPLGMALSLERRLALLAHAERRRCWIFEDDFDGEYRYDVRPIGALQGHDRCHSVIYAGSFNKMMFSSLRLGYVVLPPALVEPFLALRSAVDRYPPTLEQAVLADFMQEGCFDRHIRKSRALYLERRDALLAAGTRRLAGLLDLQPTNAGFHLLGALPATIPDQEAQTAAAAQGVEVTPLSNFYLTKPAGNGLLLGFAPVGVGAIAHGVERLARVLEKFPGARRPAHSASPLKKARKNPI
ncbi:MAG: PLP-dependent aminotransferase family protein [Opitutae bacterium]|nr:PLP-dependent aminotransferase family protein [Opitutae bacterium]